MKKLAGVLAFALSLSIPVLAQAGEPAEKKIKQGDVPKPVMDALMKKYPKAKLLQFEQEVDEGKTLYEVGLSDAGMKIDVNVSPEGKILAEEAVMKAGDLPAEVKKGLADSKYGKWVIKRAERIIENEQTDAPSYEVVVTQKGKTTEVVLDKSGKITKEEVKSAKEAKEDND